MFLGSLAEGDFIPGELTQPDYARMSELVAQYSVMASTRPTRTVRGDADPELLLEDHRVYPRSPDLVPTWHPARDEASVR